MKHTGESRCVLLSNGLVAFKTPDKYTGNNSEYAFFKLLFVGIYIYVELKFLQ
jgi:hypothetical protein